MARLARFGLCLVALLVGLCVGMQRAAAVTVIRDAEIETTLRRIVDPIFKAAGLQPSDIKLYILRDSTLNAFVAGGQNIFVDTGLIVAAKTPDEFAGVVAHETGHIAGGHLSRRPAAIDRSLLANVVGLVLGAAAAVAGAPQVGVAVVAGGTTLGQSSLLAFSRMQEESADRAAVTFLAAEHLPPEGLIKFFQVLQSENLGINSEGSVFLRTHPLTVDRINFLEYENQRSPYRGRTLPPDIEAAYERGRIKLDAFLSDPQEVLKRYPGKSEDDRYAQAIAYYRIPDLPRALSIIDGLITEQPNDPYFDELKGQMLFENGRTTEAIAPYRNAVRLDPGSALLRLGLARALLEQPDQASAKEAANLLNRAVIDEPDNPELWHFLGIAQGQAGNEGLASMALAEQALLTGSRREAHMYLAQAQQLIKPGDQAWLRLQDLSNAIGQMRDEGGGRVDARVQE